MSHVIKILSFIPGKSLRAKRQSRLANRGERSEKIVINYPPMLETMPEEAAAQK